MNQHTPHPQHSKVERHVWGDVYTDYTFQFLEYDVEITQGPNRSFTLWISLHGHTRWGPAMGYDTPEEAMSAAVEAVRRLEGA